MREPCDALNPPFIASDIIALLGYYSKESGVLSRDDEIVPSD